MCIYIYIYIYMYTHMHTYIYIYIYIERERERAREREREREREMICARQAPARRAVPCPGDGSHQLHLDSSTISPVIAIYFKMKP